MSYDLYDPDDRRDLDRHDAETARLDRRELAEAARRPQASADRDLPALVDALAAAFTFDQISELRQELTSQWVRYEPGLMDEPMVDPEAPAATARLIEALAAAEPVAHERQCPTARKDFQVI